MPLSLDKIDLGGFGIREDGSPEVDQARANMSEALKVNPDQRAEVSKLSQQSGVPEFAVEDNPAKVESDLKLNNIDFTKMSQRSPNTAKYLTDFNNSVIAQDDLEVMQSIENVLGTGVDTVQAGLAGASTGVLGMLELVARAPDALRRNARAVSKSVEDLTGLPEFLNPVRGIEDIAEFFSAGQIPGTSVRLGGLDASAEQLDLTQQILTEEFKPFKTNVESAKKADEAFTKALDGDFTGVFSISTDPVAMAGFLGQAAPSLVTSYLSGGSIPFIAWMESMEVASDAADFEKRTGTEISDVDFLQAQTQTAIVNSILEKFLPDALLKGKAGKNFLSILGSGLKEFATEGAQSFNTSLAEKLSFDPEKSLTEGVLPSALGGFGAGTVTASAQRVVQSISKDEVEKRNTSQIEQDKIDKLNADSEKSKLRERDKNSFNQFVKEADGDNNTQVFIDGAQASLYLQTKTPEEIEADPALKLLFDKSVEAAALGSDIQIPVADFATEIAGTEHYAELRDTMTLSGESVSPFRQEQVNKETENYIQDVMETARQNASEYVEAQEIYDTVREQLIDSGQVSSANASIMAKVMPAWVTVQAKSSGRTVQQVYIDSGLTVEGPQTGEAARLAGEQLLEQPSFKDAEIVFEAARNKFLDVLPEDATFDEVSEAIDQFKPEYKNFIKALERDDWLGFDFPSQAINAALSEEAENFELSQGLKSSIGRMVNSEIRGSRPFAQDALTKADPTKKPTDEEVDAFMAGLHKDHANSEAANKERLGRVSRGEVFDQSPISTETENFKKWSEGGEVVEPEFVNEYIFKADTPVVLKVFHGTTFDFNVFDAKRGNLEGQFGAINYFTSSESDASDNYAGEGPDLTNKLDQRAEPLADEIQDVIDEEGVDAAKEKYGEESYNEDTKEFALNIARQELSGGQDQTMELFVKVKNPFVIGENAEWIEFVDNEAIQTDALEQVAEENDITVEELNENLEDYEEQVDEKRWEIESETPNDLVEAIQTVSDRNGVDATNLASQVYELDSEATPENIETLLRSSEDYMYAEDPESGGMIQSQLIAEVIEEMGFDSIILRNAEDRFENMNIVDGTAHVHIFDSNKTNIKSVDNTGEFDPTNPDIFKQQPGEKPEARGYYDPANSVIRLTEASDLSTFLHEFAHFMYEMEINNDTGVFQSINGWYKRNADDVAKEANGYLGDKFDVLKQGDTPITSEELETILKEFDESFTDYTDNESGSIFKIEKAKDRRDELDLPINRTKVAGFSSQRVDELLEDYVHDNGVESRAFVSFIDPIDFVAMTHPDVTVIEGESTKLDVEELQSQVDVPNIRINSDGSIVTHEGRHRMMALAKAGYKSVPFVITQDEYTSDPSDLNLKGQEFTQGNGIDLKIKNAIPILPENAEKFTSENADLLFQPTDQPTAKEGSITADDVVAFLDQATTGDSDKDAAIRRAVHEQFARGFEAYLMEGKAPSIELRNAFRTFARWLTRIYQSLRNQLDVNLDDQMREVFDRLLATEEQIAAAESRARVEPMFTDAAMAGMTEEEFSDYQKKQEKVKDKQTETLRDKIIKQLTRQTTKWWKEEKQDFIDGEIESLKKERVYAAREVLRSAPSREPFDQQVKQIDETEKKLRKKLTKKLDKESSDKILTELDTLTKQRIDVIEERDQVAFKLDHATVKEMVGESKTNKIGRTSIIIPSKLSGMTAKGQQGVHPDEAAVFLGYESGAELLNDLVKADSIKDQAETNAESLMIEKYGDILTDGTIEREADEAVQNEERGKLLLVELKALAKGTNVPTIDRSQIKDLAKTNIAKLSFREIHPAKYRRAEIRAAQEAARMLAEGNREGAAAAKVRQVMNYYLGLEATEAKNETTKIVDRMARYNKKKVREAIIRAENGYWDQISKILSRFEFRKSATLKEVESINTWVKERMESDGDGLVLSDVILDESYITHWKDVPFSDLQGVSDSVKNIEHVARYANKIKLQQEEIDFKKLINNLVTHIQSVNKPAFKPAEAIEITKDKQGVAWAASQMSKTPWLVRELDGGEAVGFVHEVIMQPINDSNFNELTMFDDVLKSIYEMLENRSTEDRKRHNITIHIPELAGTITGSSLRGHQILAVALNTGNQGNLKKLLRGEGWADPENESEISRDNTKLQAVLAHMSRSDWGFVQKVWDQMQLLYPQLSEVHRVTTGETPPQVEAIPFVARVGGIGGEDINVRGGYYPLKEDPLRSKRARENEKRAEESVTSMFTNGSSIQATVNAAATNERTGAYYPLKLSLEVVPEHFQEVIHFITHHNAVRQINKIIRNSEFESAAVAAIGQEEFNTLAPWLNDVAKAGKNAPNKTFIDAAFGQLRMGNTLGIMGFKASTGIIQTLGFTQTFAEVGSEHTFEGYKLTINNGFIAKSFRNLLGSEKDLQSGMDFALERSKVIPHRIKTMDREMANVFNELGKSVDIKGEAKGLASGALSVIKVIRRNRALRKTQEVSMLHIALIQMYSVDLPAWHAAYSKGLSEWNDEHRSVRYADWVIENTQGSGSVKDLSQLMRNQGKIHTSFTMFMTFFSSLWNIMRGFSRDVKKGRMTSRGIAAKIAFLFFIPSLIEMFVRGELMPGDDEDEDDVLQRYLLKTALYPAQSIPFYRDIANGVTGDYGYTLNPVAGTLEKGIEGGAGVIDAMFDEDKDVTLYQIKGVTKLMGAAFGVPGINQVWSTGEHLYDVIEEGEELTARELLFGPDRK